MNRLNEIEARANAATEGPWDLIGGGEYVTPVGIMVAPDDGGVNGADAEFIAHARTDVPALVAALRAVLELHPRVVVLHADPEFGRMEDDAICGACIVNHEPADWPCPTVTAIRQHLGDEQ